jgi:hypothetical protein
METAPALHSRSSTKHDLRIRTRDISDPVGGVFE